MKSRMKLSSSIPVCLRGILIIPQPLLSLFFVCVHEGTSAGMENGFLKFQPALIWVLNFPNFPKIQESPRPPSLKSPQCRGAMCLDMCGHPPKCCTATTSGIIKAVENLLQLLELLILRAVDFNSRNYNQGTRPLNQSLRISLWGLTRWSWVQ